MEKVSAVEHRISKRPESVHGAIGSLIGAVQASGSRLCMPVMCTS